MRSRVPGGQSAPVDALRPQIDPEKAEKIRARIRNLNLLSFALAIPGIAIQVYGRMSLEPGLNGSPDPQKQLISALLILLGAGLVIAGLACYAIMKGRSGGWGLLGLLSVIGLIALNFLGKRCQNCQREGGANAKQCQWCHGPL